MKELSMSMFLNKADRDAAEDALIAARLKSAKIITKMQTEGTHWTLSVAPGKKDVSVAAEAEIQDCKTP